MPSTELDDLKERDISAELWREYRWVMPDGRGLRTYRIENPVTLRCGHKHTTHRVLDRAGQVHCVPAIGLLGCVVVWEPRDQGRPVQF